MNSSRLVCCLGILLSPVFSTSASAAETENANARRLLLTGKYAEAAEIFGRTATKDFAAAVGLSRAQAAKAQWEEAVKTLKAAPEHADVQAERARLAFRRGDYPAAQSHADAAIRLKSDQLLARWVRAELLRTAGKLSEADKAHRWLVDYYNEHEVKDAESLHWIGLGAAQYARWNRLNDQFSFLVKDLYPDALAAEPGYWPARYEAGLLFLEKYNQADASREFKAALELNPNAAEVHAAIARLAMEHRDLEQAEASLDRALEINPRLAEALLVKADLAWANFQPDEAAALLEKQVLPLNPVSEETLGRLAAYCLVKEGAKAKDAASRFSTLVRQVTERNEHAGEFLFALAVWLDDRNRWSDAERFFDEATRRMPQLIGPKNHLGLLAMRFGQEEKAKSLLKEAFSIDPFNVRVNNSLEVLEVLDGYETFQGEHILLRFDPKHDKLLARYAARYADKVYPELCKRFGYRPPGKPLIEIFNQAKGVRGHQWFSTRMVGLPYIGAVAASTGHIVATTSPNDSGGRLGFNWARVLRHELVHVITLQQTGFNIPHWYTEALAVEAEGRVRPQQWNEMLVRRVPEGKLFDLNSINFAFARPQSGEDWQMAYCQSLLYQQYMLEGRSEEVTRKLLAAYAENCTTPEAIQRVFGMPQADFEQGYKEYLKKLVAGMPGLEPSPKENLAELVKAQKAQPHNVRRCADLAYAYFRRGADREARQMAEWALKLQPNYAPAVYVLARLAVKEGKTEQAAELLQKCLDPKKPDLKVLNLLAGLELKAKKHDRAAELYRQGAQLDPYNLQWLQSLARVYLTAKDTAHLEEVLIRLASADPDDFAARKKLAELALARKDYAAAADWANQAVEIDVTDAEVHRTFAEALRGSHNSTLADEESEAVKLLEGLGKDKKDTK